MKIHETEHPEKYKQFHSMVTERLVRFWHDEKDIKSAIFHKLPEWAQKPDLLGWIRADEVPTAATMNELAQLSQENRELRSRVSSQEERLDGLTFEEMVNLLRENRILDDLLTKILIQPRPYLFQMDHFDETFAHGFRTKHRHHAGHLFEVLHETISTHPLSLIVDKSFPLDVLVNEAFLDQIGALSALRKKKGSALKQYIRDCISYDQKDTHLFLREERDFWESLFSVRFRDIREEDLGIQIRVGFRNLYLENRRNLGMSLMKVLISPGIISYGETKGEYKLTDTGRKFRNRMLIVGNLDSRLKTLWRDDPQESADPPA